jgi:hypothetical protein
MLSQQLPQQLEIPLTPGLLEQFPHFEDCLRASVYGCGRPLKAVAADLDMTSSELSRKLANNPNDPVAFPAQRLPDLVTATGSTLAIEWLVSKFLRDPDAQRRQALASFAAMAPLFMELARAADLVPKGGAELRPINRRA